MHLSCIRAHFLLNYASLQSSATDKKFMHAFTFLLLLAILYVPIMQSKKICTAREANSGGFGCDMFSICDGDRG